MEIAQEALTNATKHAPGTTVHFALEWGDNTVVLNVVNAQPSSVRGNGEGGGHGLIGMRERAIAVGGAVTVGPTSDGGFSVTATLPMVDSPTERDRPDEKLSRSEPVGNRP